MHLHEQVLTNPERALSIADFVSTVAFSSVTLPDFGGVLDERRPVRTDAYTAAV